MISISCQICLSAASRYPGLILESLETVPRPRLTGLISIELRLGLHIYDIHTTLVEQTNSSETVMSSLYSSTDSGVDTPKKTFRNSKIDPPPPRPT